MTDSLQDVVAEMRLEAVRFRRRRFTGLAATIDDLADRLSALAAPVVSDADRRDAERYRWLRQYNVDSYLANGKLEVLDDAIDAALSPGRSGGSHD